MTSTRRSPIATTSVLISLKHKRSVTQRVLDGLVSARTDIESWRHTDSNCIGVIHAKELQDRTLPPQQHYIRIISETSLTIDYSDDSEDHTTAASEAPFRFVLCMTPEASHRLLHAQYLQSDISFKRIAGWQEFALGGLDRASRTGTYIETILLREMYSDMQILLAIAYCRIYLTRQTAKAHQLIFAAIESVVKQDTGQTLKWRHIHANSADEYSGILHWGGDQHGGQAKGT